MSAMLSRVRVPFPMEEWQNSGGARMEQAGKEKAGALMGNPSGNECWDAEHEATNNLAQCVCEVDGQAPLQGCNNGLNSSQSTRHSFGD